MALLFAAMTVSLAAERPEAELRQLAISQLSKGIMGAKAQNGSAGTIMPERTMSSGMVVAYSSEGAGSVLLSTDDRFRPVLGYTATVIADNTELPCCMKWWLEEINRQMQAADDVAEPAGMARMEKAASAGYTAMGELVSTKWGQGSPYNTFTPTFDGENAPTGCVGTALAQILNFNEWPASAAFTGQYSVDGGKTYTDVSVSTTYTYPYKTAYGAYSVDGTYGNIDNIGYSLIEQKHIGWLMRDCGYASRMSYGADASGASVYNSALGMVDYFSYPEEAVKFAMRTYYSDNEWHGMVYSELAKGYPILYGGVDSTQGGHAFVVHGIDASGLVAVNWGWQGLYDGYFAMDAMESEVGAFSYSQHMAFGLHPTALDDDKACSLWAGEYSLENGSSSSENILFSVDGLYNYTVSDFTGTVALCFEDYDGGDVSYISIVEPEDGAYQPLYGFWLSQQICIDKYLARILENGHKYKVYMASCTEEEEEEGLWMKARVEGGIKYYVMEVDSQGTPSIIEEDTTTTSIGNVSAEPSSGQPDTMHSISGQRVGKSYRGIVIKNGKKYIK